MSEAIINRNSITNPAPLQLTLAPVTPPVTETTRRHAFLAAPTPGGRTIRAVLESCGVGFDPFGRPVVRGGAK